MVTSAVVRSWAVSTDLRSLELYQTALRAVGGRASRRVSTASSPAGSSLHFQAGRLGQRRAGRADEVEEDNQHSTRSLHTGIVSFPLRTERPSRWTKRTIGPRATSSTDQHPLRCAEGTSIGTVWCSPSR